MIEIDEPLNTLLSAFRIHFMALARDLCERGAKQYEDAALDAGILTIDTAAAVRVFLRKHDVRDAKIVENVLLHVEALNAEFDRRDKEREEKAKKGPKVH